MGHAHVTSAMNTVKYLHFRICTDSSVCRQVLVCEGCATAKARRKGVSLRGTTTHEKSTQANNFIYLDTSTIRDAGGIKVRNGVWIGIVDEFSGMGTSMFVATKRASVEATCKLFSDWKERGKPVRTVRCDNAGENKALQTRSTDATWQLGMEFEFTSAGTPQQNALVEKFFETLYNRTRATMTYANIPLSIKYIVCKMLVLHLTNLFNLEIVCKAGVEKTRFEWWGIDLPKFTNFLYPWGVAGVVFIKKTTTKKLEDRGRRMMYVGASMQHSGDTFRMFDPETKRIHMTRDVKMLQKMFYRQDGTISSDQQHPLDTTFENLNIIREEVTGDASTTEVSVNNPDPVNDNDETSLVTSNSYDHTPSVSSEEMPGLARRQVDTTMHSDSTASSVLDDWSVSPSASLEDDGPDGVRLAPPEIATDGDQPETQDAVEAANLPPEDPVPIYPPIPTVINLPPTAEPSDTDDTVPRTRSGRRITTPSRYRDAGLTTFVRPHSYSIFDIEDELMSDDNGEDSEPTSLFAHGGTPYYLNKELYGLSTDEDTLQRCNDIMARAGVHSRPPPPITTELSLVGAVGTAFDNTTDLHVKRFREAMASPQKDNWLKAVDDEFNRFMKNKVFRVVSRRDLPRWVKELSSVWNLKLKANGTYRARLTMRGYEQIPGIHYDPAWVSAPVTSAVTVRVVLVLLLMMNGYAHIVDVCSAFLLGLFDNEERIYASVPQGWEDKFPPSVVLLLLKTVYGLKQAANCFYRLLVSIMTVLTYKKSFADPCLYHQWDDQYGLLIWISYCDDLLCVGNNRHRVLKEIDHMKTKFEVDDVGPLSDYLGCNLDFNWTERSCRFTQPVLIQSLRDEHKASDKPVPLPAQAGVNLRRPAEGEEVLSAEQQKTYRGIVGRLLHMTAWSRPDLSNATREVSRYGHRCTKTHLKALIQLVNYAWQTPKRGWYLKPTRAWDGIDKSFKFRISGKSDSSYATCVDTRKSVTGYVVYLEGAPVAIKSVMQRIIALSVTEAELIALVQCTQEMFFVKKILESLGLCVELPMKVQCDNKGAVDLINGHSIGGNTKHIDVRILHVRDHKEKGIIAVEWIPTHENESDMCTKNNCKTVYNKHSQCFVGRDEYHR